MHCWDLPQIKDNKQAERQKSLLVRLCVWASQWYVYYDDDIKCLTIPSPTPTRTHVPTHPHTHTCTHTNRKLLESTAMSWPIKMTTYIIMYFK